MGKLIVVLIIIALIVGAYFMFRDEPVAPLDENQGTTVTYTDTGFSPKTITIKRGDAVNFVNQSSGDMWVASAMHPTHIVYSGTTLNEHCPDPENDSFDQCVAGDSFSFTFDKVGTWNYHDHLGPTNFGTVVVE